MKPVRPVYVVGGMSTSFIGKGHPDFVWKGHPDFGKRENPTLEDHLTAAILGTLAETGVAAEQLDRGFVGNFAGETFSSQGHLGAMAVRAHPALHNKPWYRFEAACASGGVAMASAVDALQGGADVVMVVGAEVQTTVSPREGADFLARAAHYSRERGIDEFTFPAMFARRWKAYSEAFGATEAELGHVSFKAYENANRNPRAHMTKVKKTLEWAQRAGDDNPRFLKNVELRDFLKVSDGSQVSDGGSGVILCTEKGLERLGKSRSSCAELAAYGVATGPLAEVADYTQLSTTRAAATVAFRDAGITARDVNVLEVHDCFAITEWLMLEALGFADRGQARELTLSGATSIEGRLPVNTGGGLIGFGHPVGATGVKQVVELYRQMKGLCGAYQMPRTPEIGVTVNMGGDDRTAAITVLRNLA